MSEPGEKLDPAWVELERLKIKLRGVALRLFAERGCFGDFVVLPGTSTCAADLVGDTIGNLLIEGYWHPGTGGEDPFPIAYQMLYRDFLDLVKSSEHTKAVIMGPTDAEQLLSASHSSSEQDRAEAQLRLESYRRPLANDPEALELLELHLSGVEKRADKARAMKITEQAVTNIQKRLVYKVHRWEQSFWDNKAQ
ncbi:MAG TPA: hypothetical protein VI306_21340 [Pyrinomonadaceae bacterium]